MSIPRLVWAETKSEPVFHRGVNLSSWFANAPRQPLFDPDFKQIKKAGFDHVRIPINPEFFGFSLASQAGFSFVNFVSRQTLSNVDRAIDLAIGNGLAVILDLHPEPKFQAKLEKSEAAETSFIQFWESLIARYAKHAPDMIGFELLNEPQYHASLEKYHRFMSRTVRTLRQKFPTRTLIVGAPQGSSIDGLLKFKPIMDSHTLYVFHFYEPYIVTHQGATWGSWTSPIPYFRAVPYPSNLVDRNKDYAPIAPNRDAARKDVQYYASSNWNHDRIAARIRLAANWARTHHVRVLCTEFGVFRKYIEPADRYRWIRDVRKALEENGIGWALWDYTDAFGITRLTGRTVRDPDGTLKLAKPGQGSRIIEPDATKALFGP
jgi:endoglucanase